ncbi:hypothetical protein CTRI78_v004032 [Colletotrichum trifolii]|uniref:Uncharacterized protein n=1 Tax=Colletotrichum trifolii TaxID=5466 RepID=A0A4R8RHS7_COLTR|nr:hypothetical protein CTRI78_v004032 [Colletotrichum trifolii]
MPHRQLTTLQHMAAFTLLLSSQLPRAVAAEELDAEDVPAECVPLCAPMVQLTARCEAQTTQRFGNLGRRWDGFLATHDVAERRRSRRRRRKQESVRKRQGSGSDGDSDSSDDEEAEPPSPALAAANQANKVCVCEERGFDVARVANVCAGCIARNGTAVDADEDIKEMIAECGFTTPPAIASTTSTLSISLTSSAVPSTVEVPVSTAPRPMLAPINPSTLSSAPTSTPGSRGTCTESVVASVTVDGPITPVTVFETPAFKTLPPIILPNDQPLRTGVQSGGPAMRSWFRGGIIGVWVVMVILFWGCL